MVGRVEGARSEQPPSSYISKPSPIIVCLAHLPAFPPLWDEGGPLSVSSSAPGDWPGEVACEGGWTYHTTRLHTSLMYAFLPPSAGGGRGVWPRPSHRSLGLVTAPSPPLATTLVTFRVLCGCHPPDFTAYPPPGMPPPSTQVNLLVATARLLVVVKRAELGHLHRAQRKAQPSPADRRKQKQKKKQ